MSDDPMKRSTKIEAWIVLAGTAWFALAGCKAKTKAAPPAPLVEVVTVSQLFLAELNLARTQRDQLLAVVALHKALGRGWRDEMKPNP